MRKQHGVTLLETLIAILVLSFGMLGMLGVIINSLKLTTSSNYRTIAAQYAYSMADIARGTPALLASYAAPTVANKSDDCLKTAGCTSTQLISTQLDIWQKNLALSLPSGQGTICRDSTPSNGGNQTDWKCDGTGPYIVKVCWDETRVAVTGGQLCTWTNI